MANTIKIDLSEPRPIKMDLEDGVRVNVISMDHKTLHNLDYENSGHTGFMPQKLSLLPELNTEVSNERLILSLSDGEIAKKITFNNFAKRIITTSDDISNENLQVGQYLFLEIKK